jgi:hypothetical protein
MGALYSTRQHSPVSGELSEFFNARARIYVDAEMDSPCLATAQAIVVLAAYETCNCRDSRAWLYVGMAVQLITELGLHVHIQAGEEEEADSDAEGVDRIRKQLFWAVWLMDCFHGVYNGRPSLMSNMKVRVPSPVPPSYTSREPYMDRESHDYPTFDMAIMREIPLYVSQSALKLGKILETLYTPIPGTTGDVRAFVAIMANKLINWRLSLPAQFRLGQGTEDSGKAPLPFMILLHLLCCEAIIFLHRPFLASNRPWNDGQTARQICSNSAV